MERTRCMEATAASSGRGARWRSMRIFGFRPRAGVSRVQKLKKFAHALSDQNRNVLGDREGARPKPNSLRRTRRVRMPNGRVARQGVVNTLLEFCCGLPKE